jgi:AAHS family 4-hydroxybenzoate transporter-like MFS transporter
MTAHADSYRELIVVRFLTGLGLGGAMPSFISLAAEFVPARLRATIVAALWAGFPLGGALGGLLASRILPVYGWQALFYIGGVLPLVLSVVLMLALPESLRFLVARGASPERIGRILRRVLPGEAVPPQPRFVLGERPQPGVPIRHLFDAGRAPATVLLWISYFIAFMSLVTNSAWTPSLLRQVGVEVTQTAVALAAFNGASVVGSGVAGYLIMKLGAAPVLAISLAGGAIAYALIGFAAPSIGTITMLQALFGLLLGCGSSGLIAFAPALYPTAARSTGVGWAMGMGRFGSFVGPLVVGALLARHAPITTIFLAIGLPGLVAAATSWILGRRAGAANDT